MVQNRIYAIAIAILILFAVAAFATTVQSNPPEESKGIIDDNIGEDEGCRVYYRIALPPVPNGATITGAMLHVHISDKIGSPSLNIGAYVETGADTNWDSSTVTFVTLNGISKGTQLDSETITDATITATFDVLGDATKGILKEYNDDQVYTNIILRYSDNGDALGDEDLGEDITGAGPYISVGIEGFPGTYLEITYTGGSGAGGATGKVSIGGILEF